MKPKQQNLPPGLCTVIFETPDLDFRDIGIVTTSLHRIFNRVAVEAYATDLPALVEASGVLKSVFYRDALFVSLVVTELTAGSFISKAQLKQLVRDLSIGVTTSLIATVIWSMHESAPRSVTATPSSVLTAPAKEVLVIHQVNEMVKRLSQRGKPWKLHLKDEHNGLYLDIESK